MNKSLLILLLSLWDKARLALSPKKKAEVSEVDYSSKAKGSNVREFFVPIGTVNRKRVSKVSKSEHPSRPGQKWPCAQGPAVMAMVDRNARPMGMWRGSSMRLD